MIKNILTSVCMLLTAGSFAQQKITKPLLNGKWFVAAMHYDGVYHNFDTDSTGFSPAVKAQMKTPKDSAKIAGKYEIFFEIVKGASFVFDPSGMYLEIDQQKNVRKGTYALNEASSIISTTLNKRATQLQAGYTNNILWFKDLKNTKQVIYYCRKA